MEVLEEVKQQNIEENQPLDPLENVSERSFDESSFLEDNRQINEDVSVYSDNEVTSENNISGKVLIKERYEIDFSNHLSWLDNNNAPAYAVTDRIDATKKLFALICPCDTAPRLSILSFLKSTYIPNLMKLVDYGVIEYPLNKTHNMALIYVIPQGGKVFVNGTSIVTDINPELFKKTVLGILSMIDTLKSHGISHRSIRTDNLYFQDAQKSEIIVGDCASTFPAYFQPPVFETIENLYASISGRGNGSDKDDIYSLGVTALCLATGKEFSFNCTPAEMLYKKMKKGSYILLAENLKIPTNYIPALKGMLNDVPENRWGHSQIYATLEGKPLNHSNQASPEKPKRALAINGEKCYTPNEIVYALYSNIEEAFDMLINGKITEWVKNALENEKIKSKIETIVGQAAVGKADKDLCVAKICITLNPDFPIRYKGITFFPSGLPKMVFLALKEQKSLNTFVEIFNSDLIKLWYQEQERLRSPANATEFRSYINRRDIGYGLERIIYDFDDDLPCTSPLFGNEFVDGLAPLLRALNNNYSETLKNSVPYDRTIIAYLRCKIGKKIENVVVDLNSSREEIKASALLHLYANIQNKHGPALLINLTKWVAHCAHPIIQIYHNKHYQKFLEKELLKVYKKGRLIDIINLLENEEALYKDKVDYAAALNETNALLLKKNKYLNQNDQLENDSKEMAIKALSIFALFVMLASFAYNLVMWIFQ